MKIKMNIIKGDSVFLIHYKSNKFKKLEHKRGEVSKTQFSQLMRIVPPSPKMIDTYRRYFTGKVNYEEIVTISESLFKQMIDVYFRWYEIETGISPKIDGVAGKAMNSMIAHLRKQCADDQEVLTVFQQLLDRWCDVPEFYKNQMELRQINSNINILLKELKNGKSDSKSKATNVSDDFRKSV